MRTDLWTRTFLALQEASGAATDQCFGFLLRLKGRPIEVDELRALVHARLDELPALTHRLVSEPNGALRWEQVSYVDLKVHVGVLDGDALARPVSAWLGQDLDQERPLWRMWLLRGDGATWGVAYLVHHAVQDGTAAIRTISRIFGDDNSSAGIAARQNGPNPLRALGKIPGLLATLRPAPMLTALPAEPRSRRHLTTRTVPLEVLKSISEASGATIAQVHLAAMTEAIRRWSPADFTGVSPWPRRRALPICVPLDTERAGEHERTTENLIGLMRIALPCGEPVVRRQLRIIMRRMSRRRIAIGKSASRALVEATPMRVGGACLARLGDRRNVAMTASVFRSVSPLTIAGVPVDEVIGLPWLPAGHSCFSMVTRYRGQATLSVLTALDVTDSPDLAECWANALYDLRSAFEW